MKYQPYSSYKASGVAWLGDVPEHWDVIRLKNILHRRITDGPHTTPIFVDEGVPFLSVDGIQDGELKFDGCRYISESDHFEYRRKALPQKDDLLMGKAASTGKIARVKVDFEFSIWSPLALIKLDCVVSNSTFFEYSLKSPIVQAQIDNLCTANTQKNISMDDIPKLVLTRPALNEQQTIANFLDHETAKIDTLIEKQRRLIELLKEKRQAVISQAVTKGLNPNAPMKDSGVEWLGDVPEHWSYGRLSYVCKFLVDGTHHSPESHFEGDYLYITAKNIKENGFDFSEITYITKEDHKQIFSRCSVQKGDVLYIKDGATAGIAMVNYLDDEFSLLSSVALIRPMPSKITSNFLAYHLNASQFKNDALNKLIGGAMTRFTLDMISRFILSLPPIEEQNEIVDFLNSKVLKIDNLIKKSNQAIELMQERRTALISAAVTGKIDVRDWRE